MPHSLQAAPREMRRHESGFDYLPMLLKNDPDWDLPDPWDRPRPQSAQWALSHAIFPGRVFDAHASHRARTCAADAGRHARRHSSRDRLEPAPLRLELQRRLCRRSLSVAGHEAGRARHLHRIPEPRQPPILLARGAAATERARRSPMSATCPTTGPAPSASATSATCWLSKTARICACWPASPAPNSLPASPTALAGTPTRFGRLNLNLEPLDRGQGWRLTYERQLGPAPGKLSLPASLGSDFHFIRMEGAHAHREGDLVLVDPAAARWSAFWKS